MLFKENEIHRAHVIIKPFLDKKREKNVRSITAKIKSWKAHAMFYKSRPKKNSNRRTKPGLIPFRVSLDLTKRRYLLLANTNSIMKGSFVVMFAFPDINCFLALKLNGSKFHHFNSKDDLIKIL